MTKDFPHHGGQPSQSFSLTENLNAGYPVPAGLVGQGLPYPTENLPPQQNRLGLGTDSKLETRNCFYRTTPSSGELAVA